MSTTSLTWTYENHAEAAAQLRYLTSLGYQARMRLAYAGNGWRVSARAGS